jgi:hypothetical protein
MPITKWPFPRSQQPNASAATLKWRAGGVSKWSKATKCRMEALKKCTHNVAFESDRYVACMAKED